MSSAIWGPAYMVPVPAADRGEMTLAAQDGLDRTGVPDRKNNDRHTVLSSKRERRRVHDFQVAVKRFLVIKPVDQIGKSLPTLKGLC